MRNLKKYRVTGWLKVSIDVEQDVEAKDEEEAKELILAYRTQKSKGNVTTNELIQLFENNKVCKRCNSPEFLEIDHIFPLSKGGHHVIDNLQILCRKCNRSKGAKICLV